MATNKTIDPTNVIVQIPAMADKPNQATNSNCLDKIIDGVNAVNSKIASDWGNASSWCESIDSGATTYWMKFGKVTTITFQGNSRSHTEDEIFMTIPSGSRPSSNMYITGNIGVTPVVIRIRQDNGQVSLYSLNGAGTGRIYFSVTYITV